MDKCRNRLREGGTGLMFQDSFHVKKAGGCKHESLKFLEWIAVIIYRPNYLSPFVFRRASCDI